MNLKTTYDNLKNSFNTKDVRIDSEIVTAIYEIKGKEINMCFRNKGNIIGFPLAKLLKLSDELKDIYDVYGRG